MKKLLILLLSIFLLVGCSFNKKQVNTSAVRYTDIYKLILDNDKFQSSSVNYDFQVSMSKLEDGTYRYYLFIDNPRIAMYDIEALIIEDGSTYINSDTMSPSIGVLEDKIYNMIPYQVNTEDGFVKGLVLSGITDSETVTLKGGVQWKNADRSSTTREFITVTYTYNEENAQDIPEEIEEDIKEETKENENDDKKSSKDKD